MAGEQLYPNPKDVSKKLKRRWLVIEERPSLAIAGTYGLVEHHYRTRLGAKFCTRMRVLLWEDRSTYILYDLDKEN